MTSEGRLHRPRPRLFSLPIQPSALDRVNEVTGQLPDEYMRDTCPPKARRRRIDIVRHGRAGTETRRWTLHGACITVIGYDDLEGGNTENSIEKMTLSCQYRASFGTRLGLRWVPRGGISDVVVSSPN